MYCHPVPKSWCRTQQRLQIRHESLHSYLGRWSSKVAADALTFVGAEKVFPPSLEIVTWTSVTARCRSWLWAPSAGLSWGERSTGFPRIASDGKRGLAVWPESGSDGTPVIGAALSRWEISFQKNNSVFPIAILWSLTKLYAQKCFWSKKPLSKTW